MTEIKKYPPSRKIYSSQDGFKATEFRITQYIKDEIEKGWRLTVEFTLDNWKTKKSILLQDQELVDLYLVLSGKKKEMSAMRKEPTKSFKAQFQGTHSFITYSQQGSDDKYAVKVSPYDAFIIIGMIIKTLQFDLHVKNDRQDSYFFGDNSITFILDSLSAYGGEVKTDASSTPGEKTQESTQIPHNYQEDGIHCTACGKTMDVEKEAKVIDFPKKKFKRIVCMNCQKG